MKRMRDSIQDRGALLVRLVMLALVVSAVGFCDAKKAAYFLGLGDGGGQLDTQKPVFSNLQPCAPNLTLNATFLRFDVTDPSPGTGINTSAATARTATGANLPLSFSGSTGTVDLSGQTDGAHAVTVSVPDNATPTANVETTTFNFTLDRTAPTFNFTTQPAATASSNAASFNFDFAGTLTSGTGRLEVTRRANADAECAATDQLWPQGTAGGQVSVNTVTIPTGQFAFSSTGFNSVPAGGTPVVAPYGFRVTAEDQAVSNACPATPNPNRTTLCLRNNLTWEPQTGTGFPTGEQIQSGWSGNRMLISQTGSCTPSIAGSFTGSATFDGFQHTIGLVNWDPLVSPITGNDEGLSTTFNATGTVTLTNGFSVLSDIVGQFRFQGTIPNFTGTLRRRHTPPGGSMPVCDEQYSLTALKATGSSSRFKQGIVALLPEGVSLLGLRPVAFRYLAPYGDPAIPQVGLIAEEVVRVYPEAVALGADGRPAGIYYSVLTGRLIERFETRVKQALDAGVGRLAGALE
jgi:hypothetical protein